MTETLEPLLIYMKENTCTHMHVHRADKQTELLIQICLAGLVGNQPVFH